MTTLQLLSKAKTISFDFAPNMQQEEVFYINHANGKRGVYCDEEILLDLIESLQYKHHPERLEEETKGSRFSTSGLLAHFQ